MPGGLARRALLALLAALWLASTHAESASATDAQARKRAFESAVRIRQQEPAASSTALRAAAAQLVEAADVTWPRFPELPALGGGSSGGSGEAAEAEAGPQRGAIRLPSFPQLVVGGDAIPDAVFELSEAVQRGEGVASSQLLAWELLHTAASLGSPDAQAEVAFRMAMGIGQPLPSSTDVVSTLKPMDVQRALLLYYFAAAGNSTLANLALGYRHSKGLGVPKSCTAAVLYYNPVAERVIEKARLPGGLPTVERIRLKNFDPQLRSRHNDVLQYYQYSADFGNRDAQTAVGQLLNYGQEGIQRDHDLAFTYLAKAAAAGDTDAMVHLGHMYANGLGTAPSNESALHWFTKAASGSRPHGGALYGLGYMHLAGYGVEQDYSKALDSFEKAAAKGHVDAHFHLGVMYLNGWGMKKPDVRRSFFHFTQAAQVGQLLAMYNTAMMMLSGSGTEPNCGRALTLLKKVALRGPWSKLMQQGSDAYTAGDHAGALLLYLRGSEIGYELAQSNAAWLLETSPQLKHLFLRRDHHSAEEGADSVLSSRVASLQLAVKLHTRAEDQGNTEALLALGDAYYYGSGVLRDWSTAANYYRQAKQAGNVQAMWNLGYMHQFGAGLPRDLHLAKRYYDMVLHHEAKALLAVRVSMLLLQLQEMWENVVAPLLPSGWADALLPQLSLPPLHREPDASPAAPAARGDAAPSAPGRSPAPEPAPPAETRRASLRSVAAAALLRGGAALREVLSQMQAHVFALLEGGERFFDITENFVLGMLVLLLVYVLRIRQGMQQAGRARPRPAAPPPAAAAAAGQPRDRAAAPPPAVAAALAPQAPGAAAAPDGAGEASGSPAAAAAARESAAGESGTASSEQLQGEGGRQEGARGPCAEGAPRPRLTEREQRQLLAESAERRLRLQKERLPAHGSSVPPPSDSS